MRVWPASSSVKRRGAITGQGKGERGTTILFFEGLVLHFLWPPENHWWSFGHSFVRFLFVQSLSISTVITDLDVLFKKLFPWLIAIVSCSFSFGVAQCRYILVTCLRRYMYTCG